jgi:tRNA A37 threonylcarbamoyladenosine biosynthesis protein TsaE
VHDELDNGSGLLVIEWADRFPELVPPGAVWVRIRHAGEGRREFSVEP